MKKTLVLGAALFLASTTVAMAGTWGYEGQTGVYTPEHWGHVSEACDGSSQSPIDIVTDDVQKVDGVNIDFAYKGKTVDYLNNGHAVTAYPNNRSIAIDGADGSSERYELVQFHFHTLSEHTVNGKHYDMEMHLVHANEAYLTGDPSGKLAVLGVFIEEGDENKELEEIFKDLPHASHDTTVEALTAEVASNYKKILPEDRKVFSYQGSLTTPGCNEIVSWFVFEEPIELSAEQIEDYRELFVDETTDELFDTNRPTQALNGRVVSFGKIR